MSKLPTSLYDAKELGRAACRIGTHPSLCPFADARKRHWLDGWIEVHAAQSAAAGVNLAGHFGAFVNAYAVAIEFTLSQGENSGREFIARFASAMALSMQAIAADDREINKRAEQAHAQLLVDFPEWSVKLMVRN